MIILRRLDCLFCMSNSHKYWNYLRDAMIYVCIPWQDICMSFGLHNIIGQC